MKQNVSGGTHGASKGWQSWPSITGGVCLDTLFHNCHSKQTLENLLSIQGKEIRNINRLLNTEKIIYFQHPYHYHQQPVISSTNCGEIINCSDFTRLSLYLFWFAWTFGWGAPREKPEGPPKSLFRLKQFIWICPGRFITIVATNSHIRGCHGSSTRSRILPHWLSTIILLNFRYHL